MLLPPGLPPIKSDRQTKRPASIGRTSAFILPSALNADRPAERRGLGRDGVRVLVLERQTGDVSHTRFDRLADHLKPGDLLVFTPSRTLPATLVGRCEGS